MASIYVYETADLKLQALVTPESASVDVSGTDTMKPKCQCKIDEGVTWNQEHLATTSSALVGESALAAQLYCSVMLPCI